MKRIFPALLFCFVLCSGFLCTDSQIHNLRVANADLASALNHGAQEVITLDAQGTISNEEERAALLKINTATNLSDGISACLDTASGSGALDVSACVRPLLQGIQGNMSDLGIKSPGAQAAVTSIVDAVLATFNEFAKQGVTK